MKGPFAVVFDGTLTDLLPAALTSAFAGWLGLSLVVAAGLLAVVVDWHRQGAAARGPGGATVSGQRRRRAGLAAALLLVAAGAFATLVRFSTLV